MKTYLSTLKLTLIVCLAAIQSNVFAQAGMNSNAPDKSAVLDIGAGNKGLLIPNVALQSLTDKTSISGANPATSLLVYNTNASLTGGQGYYYWDGTTWKKIATISDLPTTTAWSITGNVSTIPGTNFIGTTDAKDMVIKTAGTERMRASSGGSIGIATITPTSKLQVTGDVTLNGALRVGGDAATAGNAGTAGQLLTSKGSGVAPVWTDIAAVKGATSVQFYLESTGQATVGTAAYTDIPGLSNISYTAPGNGTLIVKMVIYTEIGSATGSVNPVMANTSLIFNVDGAIKAQATATPVAKTTELLNAESTVMIAQFGVVKGQTYNLGVQAKDIVRINGASGTLAGTYAKSGYSTTSVMMGTLIAN